MNWRRFYATTQIWLVIALMAGASSCLYTVLVIGICRNVLGLSEGIALLWVGIPCFLGLLVLHIGLLPKPLRKAGMLSDEPAAFGPLSLIHI